MELVTWEPFAGLNRLHAQLNSLFDGAVGREWINSDGVRAVWQPAVDVLESKDSYLIRAELPGMKKEDFNLELKEGTLTLTGERQFEKPAEGVEYHRSERMTGKFYRSFYLPEKVKQDGINASYRDGILEIHVPKAEEAKPRQIAITVN